MFVLRSCKKYFSHFIILPVNSETHQQHVPLSQPHPHPPFVKQHWNQSCVDSLATRPNSNSSQPCFLFGKITPVPGWGRHLHFTLKHQPAKGEKRRTTRCEQQHKLAKYFKLLCLETALKCIWWWQAWQSSSSHISIHFMKYMWSQGCH